MNRSVTNRSALLLTVPSLLLCAFALNNTLLFVLPPSFSDAGHCQFLTNWSLFGVNTYLVLSTAAYVSGLPLIWRVKHYLHPVAFTVSLVVACVYWPLRLFLLDRIAYDPNKFNVPLAYDAIIHLVPTLALFVEHMLFMPQWNLSKTGAFLWSSAVTGGYWLTLHTIIDESTGGRFPYVFLDVPVSQRAIIFIAIGLIGFCGFVFFDAFHKTVVGPPKKVKTT